MNTEFYKYIPLTRKSASCAYGDLEPRLILRRTILIRHPTSTSMIPVTHIPERKQNNARNVVVLMIVLIVILDLQYFFLQPFLSLENALSILYFKL